MNPADKGDKLQKLYYRIGEVASLVGVEPHVLRYWESEFRSVRPQKSARGQRIYSRRDVDTLMKVKELLYAHRFTIAGAKKKLREGGVEPLVELAREAAPAIAVEVVAAPVAAPVPSASLEELRVIRDRLVRLRDRARELMGEVDSWGD